MSRNNANTCLRIFNSIQYYGLDITRATLTSGAEIAPYLKAFKTDLFLSANSVDVQSAINDGIAAGLILTGAAHADAKQKIDQIRIAFDGDAVLFSAESEKIFQKNGIQAFEEHEKRIFSQSEPHWLLLEMLRRMNAQSKHSATGVYQSMKRSS